MTGPNCGGKSIPFGIGIECQILHESRTKGTTHTCDGLSLVKIHVGTAAVSSAGLKMEDVEFAGTTATRALLLPLLLRVHRAQNMAEGWDLEDEISAHPYAESLTSMSPLMNSSSTLHFAPTLLQGIGGA